jgi:hypothetical protein
MTDLGRPSSALTLAAVCAVIGRTPYCLRHDWTRFRQAQPPSGPGLATPALWHRTARRFCPEQWKKIGDEIKAVRTTFGPKTPLGNAEHYRRSLHGLKRPQSQRLHETDLETDDGFGALTLASF